MNTCEEMGLMPEVGGKGCLQSGRLRCGWANADMRLDWTGILSVQAIITRESHFSHPYSNYLCTVINKKKIHVCCVHVKNKLRER
jgi:hypothetical protein